MEFLNYFGNVFSTYHIFLLLGGTLVGIILGALPGLSPTMSVALLIPFTFHMEPASGLILLGTMYTATVAGGAISAILVNVPGAPANIATALDGHVMAKKGRAQEALQYCFISSFIGGVIGVMVLVLFTPILASWSLAFGPVELFWVALLGIIIIGTIDSKSITKGLLSGLFGLILSTIGDNPTTGEQRFVINDHLEGGIHIVVALIALFAVPQIFKLLENYYINSLQALTNKGTEKPKLLSSLRYNLNKVKALSIGSTLGVLIGIIPGAGGQVAGLIAYDQVKKTNKNPEKFGKGNPEGIIAAESANNAMVGPSLIPLLILGIPGSPTAAVLLGGLLIHGIFPGHDIFESNKEVIWTFVDSLLIAQVLMLVIGLLLARHSGWIMKVPDQFMAAAILILAVFGTYSVQNSYSDVLIMFTLGTAMFFASKAGFSAIPLVLGIILGPIVEENFLIAQLIGNSQGNVVSYFFTGTINIVLIAICIASIGYGFYSNRKKV